MSVLLFNKRSLGLVMLPVKSLSVGIVYHNEISYLPGLVQSLMKSFGNIPDGSDVELIFVDNCSTDGSARFLVDYFKKLDNLLVRVVFLEEPRKGIDFARNKVLDNFSNAYLSFVDADDEVMPNYFSHIFSLINYDFDVLYLNGSVSRENCDGRHELNNYSFYEMPLPDQFFKKFTEWFCYSFVIKRSVLSNIRFSCGLFEDLLFFSRVADCSARFFISREVIYSYLVRRDSITRCPEVNLILNFLSSSLLVLNKIKDKSLYSLVAEKSLLISSVYLMDKNYYFLFNRSFVKILFFYISKCSWNFGTLKLIFKRLLIVLRGRIIRRF